MKEEEFRTNLDGENLVIRFRKITNEDILKGDFKNTSLIRKTFDDKTSDIVSFDKASHVFIKIPTISIIQCINHTELEKRDYTLASFEFKHASSHTADYIVNAIVPSSNSDINEDLEEKGLYLISNVYIV